GVAAGKEAKSVNVTVGGSGAEGGDAKHVTVTNRAAISTMGDDAMGIQAQSLGGGGGNGGFAVTGSFAGPGSKSLAATVGGQGGGGGNGGRVDILAGGSALVETQGERSIGVQAQSVGGGGGNGGVSGAGSAPPGGTAQKNGQ